MRHIRFIWSVVLLALPLASECQTNKRETEHGTCAVFLQNGQNLAFVIDSVVSLQNATGESAGTKLGCKVWSPRSSMIAAITGFARHGSVWDGYASARSALARVADPVDENQMDRALRNWADDMIKSWNGYFPGQDGQVSTLILAYRSGPSTYYAFEEVDSTNHRLHIFSGSRRVPLYPEGYAETTAGDCHDIFNGKDIKGPMSDTDKQQLTLLSRYAGAIQITNSSELGSLALSMEKLLAGVNKAHGRHPEAIGPPYQVALLNADSTTWETEFVPPCK